MDDFGPTETFVKALDGDRTAALDMMKSFVKYNADSNNETTIFIAQCLSDFLAGVKPGMNPEDTGNLLRESFRQQGKILVNERRDSCITGINMFCNGMAPVERNAAIRANLKAHGHDGGKTDAQLNKLIRDTLRRNKTT